MKNQQLPLYCRQLRSHSRKNVTHISTFLCAFQDSRYIIHDFLCIFYIEIQCVSSSAFCIKVKPEIMY